MTRMISAGSDLVHTDTAGARLSVDIAIPGPGRRLTITWHEATLHVDLTDAAHQRLIEALDEPHPMVDVDTLGPW